jgi:hypothetical protein
MLYPSSLIFDSGNITEEAYARIKNTQEAHSKSLIDLSRKETLRDAEIIVLFTVELLSKICDRVRSDLFIH